MWTSLHLLNNHDSNMKKRTSFVTRTQNPGLIEAAAATASGTVLVNAAHPLLFSRARS